MNFLGILSILLKMWSGLVPMFEIAGMKLSRQLQEIIKAKSINRMDMQEDF